MKYWIFQSNQVIGPYASEDLAQLPGYSPETLVCPEGRKGTKMGDWQRAGMVPELLSSLRPLATATQAPEGLKELEALESLQEKVHALEASLAQMQEALGLKESDISGLRRELEEKTLLARELASKVGDLEARLSSLLSLREGLDRAVAAEREIEATLRRQGETIEALAQEISGLKSPQAPLAEEPAPSPAPTEAPEAVSPSFAQPLEAMPREEPEPLVSEPAPPETLPGAFPEAQPAPPSSFQVVETIPTAPPLVEEAAPAPRSRKKPLLLAGTALALLAGALALKSWLAPPKKESLPLPQEAETSPLPPPPPPAAPVAPPSPEAQAEQLKESAVSLVKSWPTALGMKTVAQVLEGEALPQGALSPWMCEKVKDEIYQVNFYKAVPDGRGTQKTYQFEADLGEMKVLARNEAARELLLGKTEVPTAAPKKKGARQRKAAAAQAPALEELLKPGEETPRAGREPLDELLPPQEPEREPQGATSPESQPEPPSPPKGEAGRGKAADEKLLDELLKP